MHACVCVYVGVLSVRVWLRVRRDSTGTMGRV